MTPKEKALVLLNKVNGKELTLWEWNNCSIYAKNDLKRKVSIIINEVNNELIDNYSKDQVMERYNYWVDVKAELEKL